MTFIPSTPLEQAVHAGEFESVIALLRDMTAEQRTAASRTATQLAKLLDPARGRQMPQWTGWGSEPTWTQRRAAAAVALVCGTARQAALLRISARDILALGTEFRPASLDGLGDAILNHMHMHEVHALIAAGVIARPVSDHYTIRLMGMLRESSWPRQGIDDYLKADPGLRDALLRMLDVEGHEVASLAYYEQVEPPEARWSNVFIRLIDEGMYSRALFLDKTLAALERDWIQSRSRWFLQFHEKLAPALGEMTPHLARYLALLGSRIPPTVTFALDAIKQFDAAELITAEQLLVALRPVISSAIKKQVEAAFKLLDRAVKRQPAIATEAAALILPALTHESADFQRQVLRRLDVWGMNSATRLALRKYASGIAAVNREELQRLSGDPLETVAVASQVTAEVPIAPIGPLHASRRLEPITSMDELVEHVAYVFEHDTDIDELERVLGGLVQAAPLSQQARERFAPVAQRLPRLRTVFAWEVGRLLHFLVSGQRITRSPTTDWSGTNLADQHLIQRVDGFIDLAARGSGLIPLSTPTHRRGFIDPAVLVERAHAHAAANTSTTPLEQASALLRLAPDADSQVLHAARDLPDSRFARALRYALGEKMDRPLDCAVFAAAARIRRARRGVPARRYEWYEKHPGAEAGPGLYRLDFKTVQPLAELCPDPVTALERDVAARDKRGWFDPPTVGGRRDLFILYHATLVPSDMEAFFSDGAADLTSAMNWGADARPIAAYPRCLLDPTVPMTSMATLVLALALGSKDQAQTAIAVDALVQTHVEARLDAPLLAATVRDLSRIYMIDNARYAKSLRAARRIDAKISAVVVDILCAALEANSAAPLRDTNSILELLLEITIADDRKLSAHSRGTLEQLAVTGKGNSLRNHLLERA